MSWVGRTLLGSFHWGEGRIGKRMAGWKGNFLGRRGPVFDVSFLWLRPFLWMSKTPDVMLCLNVGQTAQWSHSFIRNSHSQLLVT